MSNLREVQLTLTAQQFSLIWMALHDRETRLLKVIEEKGEDSEEAALAGNDIVFLRLYRDALRKQAETVFPSNVFDLSEEPLDR